MKKRVLSLIIFVTMVISLLPTPFVYAETNGLCGENLIWNLTETTLTISGTGQITSAPWISEHAKEIRTVIIEDGITGICAEAFKQCTALEEVTIADSVVEMGNKVFYACSSLKTIRLPNNLSKIPDYTFYSCSQLSDITYPQNLVEIGNNSFASCKGLGNEFRIPDGVVIIGKNSFASCTFSTVIIPNSVKELGHSCFSSCRSLTNVVFEKESHVEKIDTNAFFYCSSLTTFTLPNSVKEIGIAIFSYCYNFQELKLEDENSNFVIRDGCLFDKDMKRIIYAFNISTESYAVPDGVEIVSSYTFDNISTLKELIIPNSVKKIETVAINNCDYLEKITVPFIGTQRGISGTYDSVFGAIFRNLGVSGSTGISGVIHKYSEDLDKDCIMGYFVPTTLKHITITDETLIPYGAFSNCSYFETITLPDTIEEIKPFAFYNCSNITEVNISKNVNEIGHSAFQGCSSLKNINYFGTNNAWNRILIKNNNDILYNATISFSSESLMTTAPEILITDVVGGKVVNILSPDNNVNMYYTIDGSDPTNNSDKFEEEIFFDSEIDITLKAIAEKKGYDTSSISSARVLVEKIPQPVASHTSDKISSNEKIMFSSELDSDIYYTIDGSDPLKNGIKYVEGLVLSLPVTIRAISKKNGYCHSDEVRYRYVGEYVAPIINNINAVKIKRNSATLQASIENKDDLGDYYVDFIYYETGNAEHPSTISVANKYSAEINELKEDCSYDFYVKIVNGDKEYISGIFSFKTLNYDVPEVINLSKDTIKIHVGGTTKINASILPETVRNEKVIWASSAPNIVSVDAEGNVSGKKNGTAVITASTGDVTAECRVVVYEKYVIGEKDFSEINMASNTKSHAEHGTNITSEGGTAMLAMSYLTRWDGVVTESKDSYPSLASSALNGYTLEYFYKEIDADYHLQNAYFIPRRMSVDDNDKIKEFVMKYGAVSTSFMANGNYFSGKNKENYYKPTSVAGSGHAVAIIGWDDDYPASAFSPQPPGDGAFICKNSWGADSHNDGYFYISYYESSLGSEEESYVLPELETKENYDAIWQYDYMGPTNKIGYTGTTYSANVFPENSKTLPDDQILRAVSFYTVAQNMSYEIYVVENYQDSSSLTLSSAPIKLGVLSDMGYHTIDLDNDIALDKGTRFAIVIKLSMSDTSQKANIFIEAPVKYFERATAKLDESYISNNGVQWTDLAGKIDNANVCIKAFTDKKQNFDILFDNGGILKGDEEQTNISMCSFENQTNFSSEDTEEIFTGFISAYTEFDSSNEIYVSPTQLPSKYDLRELNQVSPVKNQGSYGTCWAFSAYASLESCLLKRASEIADIDTEKYTKTTISNNGKTFTIQHINIEIGKTVMLILYADDGMTLAEIQLATYNGEDICFTTTKTYTNAKILIWDDLTTLTSTCKPEIIK